MQGHSSNAGNGRLADWQIGRFANPPIVRTLLLLLLLTPSLIAADWPQFLGPSRNGVYSGPPLNEKWPASGPRVLWRKQIGQGLSGPAVAQNHVILFHRVDNRE